MKPSNRLEEVCPHEGADNKRTASSGLKILPNRHIEAHKEKINNFFPRLCSLWIIQVRFFKQPEVVKVFATA